MNFWISMSMPAEHRLVRTRTTCVIHVCAEIPSRPYHSLLFVLTWGGVCLASPGPSRTILSQLGVLACVLGFCLQGFVSIASIELLPASLPQLL